MLRPFRGCADFSLLKVWSVLWTVTASPQGSYSNGDKQTLLPRRPSRGGGLILTQCTTLLIKTACLLLCEHKRGIKLSFTVPHPESNTVYHIRTYWTSAQIVNSHGNLGGRLVQNYFSAYKSELRTHNISWVLRTTVHVEEDHTSVFVFSSKRCILDIFSWTSNASPSVLEF